MLGLACDWSLGFFAILAVASSSQMEAADQVGAVPGPSTARRLENRIDVKLVRNRVSSSRTISARRFNRMARRGLIWERCPQGSTENVLVAAGALQPVKQESDPARLAAWRSRPDVQALAKSNNHFAFELHRRLAEQDANTFFSPASISMALAMIYPGAAGETRQQIANVLHFDLPTPRLNRSFGELHNILNAGNKNYRLNFANRLWKQTGFNLETPFLKLTLEHYDAEPGDIDFEARPKRLTADDQPMGRRTDQWKN